jgi:organic hydroperoxide reductase OsmC/OhrA
VITRTDETEMADRTFEYEVEVVWQGNRGTGTSGYEAYGREHVISDARRPPIPATADPAFRGDPERYSPEDLLVAAASGCHMLTYLHLCADAGVVVLEYEDRPWGRMTLEPSGRGQIEEVVLRPRIVLRAGTDLTKAEQLHETAHERCFVASTLRCPVRWEPALELSAERSGDEDGGVS